MSSHRGQATIEYIGAILLLAVALTGTAVAVAAPEIPRTVVAKLRLGLCILGADVCTRADAAARGLEPCLVSGEEHERDRGVSFMFFRGGGSDFWSVERRSDGSVVLSEGYGQSLEATAGAGVHLGPASAGGSAGAGGGFRSGRSWVLSPAKLETLLARTHGDPNRFRLFLPALLGEPAATYLEGGGRGGSELGVEAVRSLPGARGEARAVLGRRRDRTGTTYYAELGSAALGPVTDLVPGLDLHGNVAVEYRTGDPPALTLRTAGHDHDDEETQTVLRLALSDSDDRAAARQIAFAALADPTLALRDLIARIRDRGTVERFRYRLRHEQHGGAYGAELGVKLGYDDSTVSVRRELVDAEVLNGEVPGRREDCLGTA